MSDRDSREGRPPRDGKEADEFKLAWGAADDRWTEAAEDKGEFSPRGPARKEAAPQPDAADDVPWDELADDTSPTFEAASFAARGSTLIPDRDEDESGPQPDDEAPPHGDPLEREADEVFEHDRPSARMDSLQDALASIRERVQSLSGTVQGPRGAVRTSELALYRAATDDRTLGELRRHSGETETLLRHMSALMQDLSLDLRSIVDAARRAIDQTSEQAESSIELGRLLGERIEQMDEQLSARMDALDATVAQRLERALGQRLEQSLGQRVDQMAAAVENLQGHLDKRLTRLEQRSGVGVVREEIGELRSDMGEVRTDMGEVRTDVGQVRSEVGGVRTEVGEVRADVGEVRADMETLRQDMDAMAEGGAGTGALEERLGVVGDQLDRTLAMLRDAIEGGPDQDDEMVDGVASAIREETEAAVEPFRVEIQELGRQLSDAVDREEQLSTTLATLTDEVQRLRKRVSVRGASTSIDEDQVQTIVDAVVAALPGGGPLARSVRRRAEPKPEAKPEPEFESEAELDVEPQPEPKPEPEPEPPPRPARRRERPTRGRRVKKASEPEPEYEVDVNEPFGPGALDLPDADLDVEPDEEPIRRARGTKKAAAKKAARPVAKSRRTRSSSR